MASYLLCVGRAQGLTCSPANGRAARQTGQAPPARDRSTNAARRSALPVSRGPASSSVSRCRTAANRRSSDRRPPSMRRSRSRTPAWSIVASKQMRLAGERAVSFQATQARVLAPTSAVPIIWCGGSTASTWVQAVRRSPSGPRRRTRPPTQRPSGPQSSVSTSMKRSASSQWWRRSARNSKTSAGGAATSALARISRERRGTPSACGGPHRRGSPLPPGSGFDAGRSRVRRLTRSWRMIAASSYVAAR